MPAHPASSLTPPQPHPLAVAAGRIAESSASALSSSAGVRAQVVALVGVATLLRVIDLGSIPGLNGDEAWYGVQAQRLCRGEGVAWRTPTGNPLNPFFFLPQVALAAWCPPGAAWLRLPAVASGLAALAVNYWACTRLFDRATATATTVALAVLPVNLAYGRFAWDASQSLLATLALTYAALALVEARAWVRWGAISVGLWGLACLVHPTNVFLAPLLVAAAAARTLTIKNRLVGENRPGGLTPPSPGRDKLLGTVPGWLALAGGTGLLVSAWAAPARVGVGIARLVSPLEWTTFATGLVRLFTGLTTMAYIPGTLRPPAAGGIAPPWTLGIFDVAGFAFVVWALAGLGSRLRAAPRATDAALAWGYLGSVAGFFVLAGPEALAPHFERYGLALVGPGVLLLARGALAWPAASRRPVPGIALLAGWLAVAAFWQHYHLAFRRTGQGSHPAFAVAADCSESGAPGFVDPKQAAIEFILRATPSGPVVVETVSWWTRWPAAYFAGAEPRVTVIGPASCPADEHRNAGSSSVDAARWRLELVGESPAAEGVGGASVGDDRRWTTAPLFWILGPAGQPVLAVRGPLGSAVGSPANLGAE